MVTAELAVAIPAVIIVLALCLGGISLGIDQVRCVDAARLGARAVARGDAGPAVDDVVARAAPAGARLSLGSNGAQVRVTVSVHRSMAGLGHGFELTATSVADQELGP
jgi:hypothetical protein